MYRNVRGVGLVISTLVICTYFWLPLFRTVCIEDNPGTLDGWLTLAGCMYYGMMCGHVVVTQEPTASNPLIDFGGNLQTCKHAPLPISCIRWAVHLTRSSSTFGGATTREARILTTLLITSFTMEIPTTTPYSTAFPRLCLLP